MFEFIHFIVSQRFLQLALRLIGSPAVYFLLLDVSGSHVVLLPDHSAFMVDAFLKLLEGSTTRKIG